MPIPPAAHYISCPLRPTIYSIHFSCLYGRKFSGRDDVSFTGYDLIPQNIETAKEKFQNESWTFKVFDIVERRIERSFDLIINRHTAIHLGLSDNIKVGKNII